MSNPEPVKISLHGLILDQMESQVAADKWTEGRNVFFSAGRSVRVPGEAPYANAGNVCDADVIEYVDNGAQAFWVYACARTGGRIGVGATDGVSHWNITPAGWAAIATKGFVLTIGSINNIPFVNHPERGPYFWDFVPAHVVAKLPGWPAVWSCRVMRAHKNFLMAINIQTETGLAEGQVSWSASADPYSVPAEWTPTATNDAGDAILSSPGGPLVDGISVRDQFFVAKANCTAALAYVGGTFVFQNRDIFPSVGVLAPGAWCENGNLVWQVTGDMEIIQHDGTSLTNVLYGTAQDYFKGAANAEYSGNIFCFYDGTIGQVHICYPTGTNIACNEALMLEVATGDISLRDLPNIYDACRGITNVKVTSWDSDSRAWDTDATTWNQGGSGYQPAHMVFGAGPLGMLEVGAADDAWSASGAKPILAYLGRGGIDFDSAYRKTISGLRPAFKGDGSAEVTFSFSTQEFENAPSVSVGEFPFVIGVDEKVDFFADFRLFGLHLQSTGGAPWSMGVMWPIVRGSGK